MKFLVDNALSPRIRKVEDFIVFPGVAEALSL